MGKGKRIGTMIDLKGAETIPTVVLVDYRYTDKDDCHWDNQVALVGIPRDVVPDLAKILGVLEGHIGSRRVPDGWSSLADDMIAILRRLGH